MKKNLIVGQSGGPTAVINSSLYGVFTTALDTPEIETVYGMVNGIHGFLKNNILNITTDVEKSELELIKTTPGAYLGSCRYKLPENLDDSIYPEAFKKLEEMNIGYFLYIGGNDSMDTVSKMSKYAAKINSDIKFIGIPKTIDNDLVNTDHTPGFGSAAKYVASTVREISMDAAIYATKSVTIVEIMGRHAGWLTAASVLARKSEFDNPVLIYLPEAVFDENAFLKNIEDAFKKYQNLVVCVSEGIHDSNGNFVCENTNDILVDNFGHKILTGCGKHLENLVKNKLGVKVRSIELNVTQRCSSNCLSLTDHLEAANAGKEGVRAAINGETGIMISFKRNSSSPYDISYEYVDVSDVCNKEKCVPSEWITDNGTNISKEFIDYCMPLIQGNVELPQKNGLPVFADLKLHNK